VEAGGGVSDSVGGTVAGNGRRMTHGGKIFRGGGEDSVPKMIFGEKPVSMRREQQLSEERERDRRPGLTPES